MSPDRVVEIQANVAWQVFKAASGRWLAMCEDLNLTLEADSEEELHSLIPEALALLMSDLLGDDELDAYLRSKGWSATGGLHAVGHADDVTINLPWHIISGGANDSERRAH